MANDLTETSDGGVPAWMKKASVGASIGNIDDSDLKPPRLKILAGMSPEVMDGVPGAQPGNYWLTIFNINLGKEVLGSPILVKRTYVVWAPKTAGSDQKGPLAVATDGVHWDTPNQKFIVRLDNRNYEWEIGRTVTETGAHLFGSSQPDNKGSKPIATLTYNALWLIDLPNGAKQLCAFTTSRTGATPTQNFLSTLRARGVDHYFQRFKLGIQRRNGPTGDPYFVVEYNYAGLVRDEAQGEINKRLHQDYLKSGFEVDLEEPSSSSSSSSSSSEREAIDDDVPF